MFNLTPKIQAEVNHPLSSFETMAVCVSINKGGILLNTSPLSKVFRELRATQTAKLVGSTMLVEIS